MDSTCTPYSEVSLQGVIAPAEEGDKATVRADFEPPRFAIAGLPALRFGPKSSVVLSTTYLDSRVRLGKAEEVQVEHTSG